MPTYIYRCSSCRRRFERVHSIAACDRAQPCPACGSAETYRIPQAARANWGGLAPSQGEMSPAVRALVARQGREA